MWDDLGVYLREVNGPEMANKSISELVALDPVSTSRFIDNKFKAMLDFIMSSDEPLGKVTHYFWRRVYQSRGAQHFHLMLCVKNAPILHESLLDVVASFISKYVTCAIPDKNVSPTLYQRVTSYQTHKHNKYCMRQKKTRRGFVKVCRFGFPRPVTEILTIRDIIESIATRTTLSPNSRLYYIVRKKECVMINYYNPAILLAWNGNTDIQYVCEKTAILNYYVIKYTTKSEKTHVADMFQDINHKLIRDINSTKPLRSRLFNIGLRVLSNRESAALWKPVTFTWYFTLYGTDPTTTIRWLDVNIFRNRRVKSKSDMMMLDWTPAIVIYYESWIDDHYPKRPKELENTNLYSFAQNYDIVKTRPVSSKVKYYEINDGKKFLKRRANPYLINHYFYDGEQVPEKYFFSLLLLFKLVERRA
ncbi:unnamed protein product [Parnassius apollo]|uniref:(apollo) hypothetical protein n=1 Tax=Parnassius apollo TaxID=110799 RepID=A0A8S3XF13_PARAO|nr:unnamed protein product [Parnassius apollo]